MGLFDRFRPQPRWKHADPAVRAAAVGEIPLEDQALLLSIAKGDAAPAVRLAAVQKLIDPAALAEVGRTDGSPEVRDGAIQVLVDTASGAFEGTSETDCLEALAAIADSRQLGAVAMSASSDAVGRLALARIDDSRVLGSVARRAEHGGTRIDALARLVDEHEIVAVALRSEFKDVSVAATDRLSPRGSIEQVAEKAKNKAASKRARVRLREMDEEAARAAALADAARRAAESAASASRAREAALVRQAESLCNTTEQLARGGDAPDTASRLAAAEAAWPAAGAAGPALMRRFEAAVAAVRERLSQSEAERALLAARERLVGEALAARQTICERADATPDDAGPEALAELKTAWAALPAMPEGAAGREAPLARRFEAAVKRSAARERQRLEREQRAVRSETLVRQFEELAAVPAPTAARGRLAALRRAWADLMAGGPLGEDLAARVAAADRQLQVAEAAAREARDRELRDNLARVDHLCEQAEAMAVAPDILLKDGERILKELRAAEDEAGPLPTREDRARLHARLKAAHAALTPKVRELRDLDEWQRWANAGVQEELCRRAESLREQAASEPAETARQLGELQSRWKEVAAAPREQAQALWQRFRVAADEVKARCEVYFAGQAEERAANLAKKEALCQHAEALSASTDWLKTAEEIKRLQAEWKGIGPVPRGSEKPLWERFRGACDRFFTRRQEDLAERKEAWAANLAKKEDLCARAEALAESNEWETAINQIKRLQAEWKSVGPVRKKKSEAVWQRFRGACDRFFERYQQRNVLHAGAHLAEREAIAGELEAILPAAEGDQTPADLISRVRSAWVRWQAAVARGGVPRPQGEVIEKRVGSALVALAERYPASFSGTEFDVETNRRRMEEICAGVEQLLPDDTPAATSEAASVTLLAQQLRDALASNIMTGRGAAGGGVRLRQIGEEVRKAQAAWKRVGPVPPEVAAALDERFQRACSLVLQQREPRQSPAGAGR